MARLSSQEIEQVVRDVMRQMGTLPKVSSAVPARASHMDSVSSAGPPASVSLPQSMQLLASQRVPVRTSAVTAGPISAEKGAFRAEQNGSSAAESHSAESHLTERRLTSRLVTLESLPKLQGLQRLVVPVRAIVTPAVQDELRRFGVKLEHDDAASNASVSDASVLSTSSKPVSEASGATGTEVVFAVVRSRFAAVEGLLRAISSEGLKVHKSFNGKCLIQATDEFSASLAGKDRLGVLVTDHAAVAMGLTNRRRGLRAVQAIPRSAMIANAVADGAIRDATEVGANLLVVDPREFGFWVLRQMVLRFLKFGPYPCPEALQQRLD